MNAEAQQMRSSGKAVIGTGGASGIGLATAQRFASKRAKVVMADRAGQRASTAAQQLLTEGASEF
jgi:NAD(P)-dependent dehydrogenase (short-subunit alcohol dehydrogenase family)